MSRKQVNEAAGFTIIELMIATLVFSVVLLIVTTGVISLTNQYYKGITSSNTQSVARAVMDTIAQDIQFSDSLSVTKTPTGSPAPASGYFCVGSHKYTYLLHQQLAKDPSSRTSVQTDKSLIQSSFSGNCAASGVSSFPASGVSQRELLTPGMRLANLVVQQGATSNSWKITVRIISGEDDLLTNLASPTAVCNSGAGSQFCAVSELTTTVESRL